jgi:hypothetical protein
MEFNSAFKGLIQKNWDTFVHSPCSVSDPFAFPLTAWGQPDPHQCECKPHAGVRLTCPNSRALFITSHTLQLHQAWRHTTSAGNEQLQCLTKGKGLCQTSVAIWNHHREIASYSHPKLNTHNCNLSRCFKRLKTGSLMLREKHRLRVVIRQVEFQVKKMRGYCTN